MWGLQGVSKSTFGSKLAPLTPPRGNIMALNGGEKFTILDLSEAYLQIPLEEESRNLVVINTHKGLCCFTRLPYGVASTPSHLSTDHRSNFTKARRNYMLC